MKEFFGRLAALSGLGLVVELVGAWLKFDGPPPSWATTLFGVTIAAFVVSILAAVYLPKTESIAERMAREEVEREARAARAAEAEAEAERLQAEAEVLAAEQARQRAIEQEQLRLEAARRAADEAAAAERERQVQAEMVRIRREGL
ncbi:hypothetical protein [Tsukamurella pulmonis]|uniref:hypothetical protein n=1 Tax=Tsukamurella pulmonis TaxID=47312 RepID=UPI000E094FE6|nr:hypothetical protein [Tsukamurella pulmonis]RDH13562.1 hypothetical protein DVB88_01770 [Tsukamurella pulmonis]